MTTLTLPAMRAAGERPRLYMTRGLPGSGKTTWATAWVAELPRQRARVNRDHLRTMLHGGRLATGWQEETISMVQLAAVQRLLALNFDVVCDDTNLDPRYIDMWRSVAESNDAGWFIYDLTDVPLDVCIERDARRSGAEYIGADVIRKLWRRWLLPELTSRTR